MVEVVGTGEAIPYQAIVEASVSPFVVVDAKGYIEWAGPSVQILLGRPAEEYVGVHFLEVLEPSSHEAAIASFTEFMRPDRASQAWIGPPMLLDLVGVDGPVTCEVSAAAGTTIGRGGAVLQVRRWRGTVLLYQAVDALVGGAPLTDVLARLIELVEHDLPQSYVTIGTAWDGTQFDAIVPGSNPAASELVARPRGASPWAQALEKGTIVGEPDLLAIDPALAAEASEAGFATCWALPILVRPDERPSAALIAWRRASGSAAAHLTTTVERVARLVAMALEAERTRATWHRAARTEGLTGLSNRTDLDDRLQSVAIAAPDRAVAALFCDLDDFKPVNDRLGHEFGDQVLAHVADSIRAVVRPSDVVARWGGDEFVVLCSEHTSPDDAVGIAQRVIEELGQPMAIGQHAVQLGVSIGVATARAVESGQLVRRADDALRDAKAAGKNQWRLAEPA
jgi:diguanylate cyclase (GGDEF)-like protein